MPTKLVIATFRDEAAFLHATREARDHGLIIVDTYTPFAVHGIEEAMGSRGTRLGVFCFGLGVSGLLSALAFQLWSSAWNWPMNIGGKSHAAVPALIPVAFEVTILFAAVGSVIAFFLRSKLWPGQIPDGLYVGVTDDRFVLVLQDKPGEPGEALQLLKQEGVDDLREEASE